MSKLLKTYLFLSGVLAHILLGVAVLFALWIKLHDHWRVNQIREWIRGPEDSALVYKGSLNNLPVNRWVKIHQMTPNDKVTFERQRHSGSTFDTLRNRLLIFGSDTHGTNWDNSIHAFDLNTLTWSTVSASAPRASYTATANGLASAVTDDGIQPWAMHTFDAINYDPINDRLIVASKPDHLKPGRFGDWITPEVWQSITTHPTWAFDFSTKYWTPIVRNQAVDFFPYATAYSNKEQAIFGFRPEAVYKLDNGNSWNKIAKSNINAYHTQAVWDAKNNTFIIAGAHDLRNDIYIYRPGAASTIRMTTPGKRPTGFQHSPMAYHSTSGQIAFVIDNNEKGNDVAQTWLYSLDKDQWTQVTSAEFPFHLGMNYHMQYSSKLDALVLLLQAAGSNPSVWLLRLETF